MTNSGLNNPNDAEVNYEVFHDHRFRHARAGNPGKYKYIAWSVWLIG